MAQRVTGDKGAGGSGGLWIGWFVSEKCAAEGVVSFLWELADPGRSSPSKVSKDPRSKHQMQHLGNLVITPAQASVLDSQLIVSKTKHAAPV